jgi:hypothetical protein
MTPAEHVVAERMSPVDVTVRCSCGWSARQSRRQNALARAEKLRAAESQHLRDVVLAELAACSKAAHLAMLPNVFETPTPRRPTRTAATLIRVALTRGRMSKTSRDVAEDVVDAVCAAIGVGALSVPSMALAVEALLDALRKPGARALAGASLVARRWRGKTKAERKAAVGDKIQAAGGKAAWKGVTAASRSEEMKRRAAVRNARRKAEGEA